MLIASTSYTIVSAFRMSTSVQLPPTIAGNLRHTLKQQKTREAFTRRLGTTKDEGGIHKSVRTRYAHDQLTSWPPSRTGSTTHVSNQNMLLNARAHVEWISTLTTITQEERVGTVWATSTPHAQGDLPPFDANTRTKRIDATQL